MSSCTKTTGVLFRISKIEDTIECEFQERLKKYSRKGRLVENYKTQECPIQDPEEERSTTVEKDPF